MHEVREGNCELEVVVQGGEEIGWNEEQLKGMLRSTMTSLKSRRSHFMGVLNIAS
jgi:hypothetical protein